MKTIYLILVFTIYSTILFSTIINIPADQPTIQAGINAAVNGDTVLVHPGTYVENINYNGKNITVASLFLTTQDTTYISQTVIDGDNLDSVVRFETDEDSTAVLSGFTITNGHAFEYDHGGGICFWNSNASLANLIVKGNIADGLGGGIFCIYNSNPNIQNVTISNNSAFAGGGISIAENSNPSIINVSITGNSADYSGGIRCNHSNPSLENVTITNNSSISWGNGISCHHNSNPSLINCILWNDTSEEINMQSSGDPNSITISYSDIQGGEAGIVTNNNNTVYWLDGNIDDDPLFVDPQIGDFHLTEISPCIDAGDPNFPFDPDNTICDMGAFYYHQDQYIVVEEIYPEPGSITISEDDSIYFYITASDPDGNPIEYIWELDSEIVSTDSFYTFLTDENSAGTYAITLNITDNYQPPSRNTLSFEWDIIVEDVVTAQELLPTVTAIYQNSPNPFNPTTTINYSLKENSKVSLNIYNIKGQNVKQLVSDQLSAGEHSVIWNGKDDNGKFVSSGIYFYKLKIANFEKTKKMILMK